MLPPLDPDTTAPSTTPSAWGGTELEPPLAAWANLSVCSAMGLGAAGSAGGYSSDAAAEAHAHTPHRSRAGIDEREQRRRRTRARLLLLALMWHHTASAADKAPANTCGNHPWEGGFDCGSHPHTLTFLADQQSFFT
jgi:hypothetical protein